MERAVAIKKLSKLIGKNLGYQIDQKAPTSDERAKAKVELAAATSIRNLLREQKERRYGEILAADAVYQKLKTELNEAQECVEKLASISREYKFTVGLANEMFFHVKAQGDSWEEVIEKLQNGK